MPRRRRSPFRVLLGLVMLAGLGVAATSGAIALRDEFRAEQVVLSVDTVIDPEPPPPPAPSVGAVERSSPLRLVFDAVDIDEEVRAVGVVDNGELEVPGAEQIGWWEYGSAPGLPGATVLAAHVSWNGSLGPFFRLGDARIGDRLQLVTADESIRTYQVIERTMYLKDSLPSNRIWTTTGDETLVLITCGGAFNSGVSRYRHNIVVYAVPVESSTAANSAV